MWVPVSSAAFILCYHITLNLFPGCTHTALAQCYYWGQPIGNRLRRELIDCLCVRARWFSLSPVSPTSLSLSPPFMSVAFSLLSPHCITIQGCTWEENQPTIIQKYTQKRNYRIVSSYSIFFSPGACMQRHLHPSVYALSVLVRNLFRGRAKECVHAWNDEIKPAVMLCLLSLLNLLIRASVCRGEMESLREKGEKIEAIRPLQHFTL